MKDRDMKNKLVTLLALCFMMIGGVWAIDPVTILDQPGWCNWCPSPAYLPDGRVALVFSRWETKFGFEAWCAKSEIALAIADTPTGPYKFIRTILPGSGKDGDFDRDVTHNPCLLVDGGKFYLYYMGTYSDLKDGRAPGQSSASAALGSFRLNQRIGVAVADRIEGPYVRTGKSIFPEDSECIMASNPAVCRMPDGRYLMVFKWGWPPAASYPICRNSCAAAIAESPLGPWKIVNRDVFPVRCANFPGEDPNLWLEGDTICCAIHDNGKFYSQEDRALIWFTSKDGINWKNQGVLFPRGDISRLERPFILAAKDGSRMLFAASKPKSDDPNSKIVAYPGALSEPNRVFDLVIYGATSAGISTAVQAKRMGLKNVVVLEPSQRIGGLTTGGLGQTDIGNKSAFGGIARQFYRDIKSHYANDASWKWQSRSEYKPKGQSAYTSQEDAMWTFEPSAALEVLKGWVKRDDLDVRHGEWLDREPGGVMVDDKTHKIVGIRMLSGRVYRARQFVDATYEGDLMAAVGVSYAIGREANSVYGEVINGVECRWDKYHQFHGPVDPYVIKGDPSSGLLPGIEPEGRESPDGAGDHRIQAYCFRMCLTDHPDNRIPFGKPEGYNELDYELLFRNYEAGAGSGPLPWINSPMPNRKTDTNNRLGVSTDYVGQNWDYPEATYAERSKIIKAHLDYQRGLMWTLANHPRIPENVRAEISRWGTCKDEFHDGLGYGWQGQLYIREARRMIGEYVMTEHECRRFRKVPRPVAMGAYGMDSHHVRRHVVNGVVRNEGDVQDHHCVSRFADGIDENDPRLKQRLVPYSIDYGAIVPKRSQCINLFVPICVSATHIAFGSIRMEPVFFALGQVAGTAAAIAICDDVKVQDVDYGKLSARLIADGQVIETEK